MVICDALRNLVTLLHVGFSRFLNCTNGIKLREISQNDTFIERIVNITRVLDFMFNHGFYSFCFFVSFLSSVNTLTPGVQ